MAEVFKAAIFDLDGTLMDSLTDLSLSTNHALRLMGWPERSLQEVKSFVGNGVGKLIARAVPEDTEAALVEQCLALFRSHYVEHCRDNTRPYEGVMALLRALRAQGVATAIVSNKLQAGVDELEREFFAGLIDVAIGEHPGARRKPAPDMVYEAVERLGVPKAQCLYVGDSDVDMLTAANAALPAVAVLWGFRDRACLEASGAIRFAAAPEELLKFFVP